MQPADRIPTAFERRCIRAGPLRSALLLRPVALLLPRRRALPARRLTALGARAALSTDCRQPADRIPTAFERRCIRAGPLRSALLLRPVALLLPRRRALPARRLTALGARAALSTDCRQPADRIPTAFERRCIRAGPLRSALLLRPVALLLPRRRALPARRLTALGARAALSTDCRQPADRIPTAFERRCIRAGPLRSALLLRPVALLLPRRRALPARRLTALGARAALSTDCF